MKDQDLVAQGLDQVQEMRGEQERAAVGGAAADGVLDVADAAGAQISRKPWALADALEKLERAATALPLNANPSTAHMFIVNPLSGASLMNLFSTHPPIEERVARLRAMRIA